MILLVLPVLLTSELPDPGKPSTVGWTVALAIDRL